MKKMNLFQKISFINRMGKAWKEAKKVIDANKEVTEEVRQIAFEFIALLERTKKVLPQATGVIDAIIGIVKNALS